MTPISHPAEIPTRVGMDRRRRAADRAGDEIPTRVGMDRRAGAHAEPLPRDPHARGDGPLGERPGVVVGERSPRAWGWTAAEPPERHAQPEIPTRVGMDRDKEVAMAPFIGDPHARGDGPSILTPASVASARSPRAWGWTDGAHSLVETLGEIPTRVGMDRWRTGQRRRHSRDPHARGDGPYPDLEMTEELARSPRAWGWTAGRALRVGGMSEIPTRVGMDRSGRPARGTAVRDPHARGDGPARTPGRSSI